HHVCVLPLRAPDPLPADGLWCPRCENGAGAGRLLRRRRRGHLDHGLDPADDRSDRQLAGMYTVEAVPAPELGNTSFVALDEEQGVGVVIDPFRDIERYLHIADQHHVQLTHALDTHLHNDFVSGRRELAAEPHSNHEELAVGAEPADTAATRRRWVSSARPIPSSRSPRSCRSSPGCSTSRAIRPTTATWPRSTWEARRSSASRRRPSRS